MIGLLIRGFNETFIANLHNSIRKNQLQLKNNILVVYIKDTSEESRFFLRVKTNQLFIDKLVIVSPSPTVSELAWHVGAHQFALIDNDFNSVNSVEQVYKALALVTKTYPKTINSISFNFTEGTLSFKLKDILYIKADGSYSVIITKDKKSPPISKRLKLIEQKLCQLPQFYRFNRSYIFNLNNIIHIKGREIGFEHHKAISFPKFGKSYTDLKDELLWNTI